MPDSATLLCADGDGQGVAACPPHGQPAYGQDGSYALNLPRYQRTSKTVSDEVTGLMWQRVISAQHYSWPDAASYCETLRLAGLDDWRLPTRIELVTLLDLGRQEHGRSLPAIDLDLFPGTPSDEFWSSSENSTDSSQHWTVHAGDGQAMPDSLGAVLRVRCVRAFLRGSLPPERYHVAAGIVTDNYTGLEWSQNDPGPLTWSAALQHCEGSNLGGRPWRLPNIKELQTIVDETRVGPALDSGLFPGAQAAEYWSSSFNADTTPSMMMYVDFATGFARAYSPPSSLYRVRCVHGGS